MVDDGGYELETTTIQEWDYYGRSRTIGRRNGKVSFYFHGWKPWYKPLLWKKEMPIWSWVPSCLKGGKKIFICLKEVFVDFFF